MKIHEYQAKEIFRRFGVPTPRGEMVTTPDQARAVAERLGTKIVVVKAQIHAGGRGKAGGVKLAKSPEEAAELAKNIMGMKLVTPQTGPAGRIVQRLLIEEGLDIKRELYLSILVDRAVAAPVIMASTAGGMEIEEVAHKNPELILRETIRPATGLQPYQARKLAFGLGLSGDAAAAAAPFLQALYRAFLETDASLAEINPLIVTGDGKLVALDAKMAFDDNALYRHKDLPRIARFERGRSAGSRSIQLQTELHQAGRQRRLHGQWRGSGHEHDGHYQVVRRVAREFPGCGRRGFRRAGEERVQDSGERSQCAGRVHQYFRRNSALRRAGIGRGGRCQGIEILNFRSWCAWKAPTWKRDRKFCAIRVWDSRSPRI